MIRSAATIPAAGRDFQAAGPTATLSAPDGATTTAAEARALAALRPILRFHERDDVIVMKVVDLPQAAIALHARAVLLISRPALGILTIPELQAAVAHEIGHDFFWEEYLRLRKHPERRARQQMALRCDGIAIMTLVALDLDPARLVPAVRKLIRFNEHVGTMAEAEYYPSVEERTELSERSVGTSTPCPAPPERREHVDQSRATGSIPPVARRFRVNR